MKKLLWVIGITGAAGYYLYRKRDDILAYCAEKMIQLEQTKNELKDYSTKVQAVKDNATKFANELQAAQPVLDSLTQDIQQYADEIEPLAEKIQADLPESNN